QTPMTLEDVQAYAVGEWASISMELRPTEDRAGTGQIQPTHLKRRFSYLSKDAFVGVITQYADIAGEVPLVEFEFKGSLVWGNQHPIVEGAWTIDYVLDEGFAITALNSDFAAVLNQTLPESTTPFEVGVQQDFLRQSFPLFNIVAGEVVSDHDLIYFSHGLLFMGAKHVDGTPFDTPERRPDAGLQVPLARVQ
ncbi:MAG: hypothetical protein AAF708_06950, partial [Deinococcota bacterium]